MRGHEGKLSVVKGTFHEVFPSSIPIWPAEKEWQHREFFSEITMINDKVTLVMGFKIPATQLVVQQLVHANNKYTPEVHITGILWDKSTGDWWFPHTKGQ